MKKLTVAAIAAFALSVGSASAADLVTKARPIVAPEPPAWDVAFGSAITNDYIFRGITQSAHKPSIAVYFEPRYNINKDLQLYAGLGGASIDFPNRAAAEIDLYGGIRPTFDKFAFDFGYWYYWYPGGQCFNNVTVATATCGPSLPNGNVAKADFSFWEIYGKVNYTFNDNFGVGAYVYYSPNVLNTGASGVFFGGTAKYTFNAFANGVQPFISGEVGHWDLGTSDGFYACLAGCGIVGPQGINYTNYTTWNVGFGWTYKVFTVDLRYVDTNLNKGDCNAFTSDHTSPISTTAVTAINAGNPSNWCGASFVAKLSADLTLNTNIK
jgi:uncharacterized protein (TIGR02001 family)